MNNSDLPAGKRSGWFGDPRTADALLWTLIVACALLLLADVGPFYKKHSTFTVDGAFAFYCFAGFLSSVGAVLVARLVRPVVKRGEDFYDPPDSSENGSPEDDSP